MENSLVTDDKLRRLVLYFEEAEDTTKEARRLSERDRDYYDNKQWTDTEIAALEKRKQPVVTYNRIQRKIDFLSGLEKQSRKDPKAFPRNPQDEAAANAATDAIRYACEDNKWDDIRSAAWDNLMIEGTCAVLVDVRPTKMGYDPRIMHIEWDRFFFDPKSSRPDFSDARYMGIVTWYDLDVAQEKWPNAKDVLVASMSSSVNETYEDKPKYSAWSEPREKRVRVCEIYHKERGQWMRCVYTEKGYLEEPAPSPFLDEDGQPENPIKAMSLYVDRDNNRYGMVRVLISPQDEINKRRSKGLHLITMRQSRISPASGQDGEKIRRELAKPDGIITAEKDDFEILPTNDMAMANLQLLQEAKNEIDLLGANSALAGKNENDMSGRAIMAQQQGGMVEVARAFDRLRSLSLEVYRAIWNRVRQVWTEERWVRVTDNQKHMRFVGLNQQVTVAQIAQEVQEGKPEGIESATKLLGAQLMQALMAGDEQAAMQVGMFVQQYGDQVVETRNAITDLDIDIVMDESMDTPTVQSEQFETLTKILPGIVNLPPTYAKMLVMASQFREKDAMLEALEEMNQPNPMAEQQAALQMEGAMAQVDKVKSEAAKNYAQAQNAGVVERDPMEPIFRAAEIETDQFNAVTDRMQAMQPDTIAA